MIGTINIKTQAAAPNIPLQPVFSFVNSPISVRVIDVPKKIGDWTITKVYANFKYPDNVVVSKEAVRVAGAWVATVDGSPVSGSCENGFWVSADGLDENGEETRGYVLGAGQLFVTDIDGTVHPGQRHYALHLLEEEPAEPFKGDVVIEDGETKIFDGDKWVYFSGGVSDYNYLTGLPSIGGHVLSGDMTASELGLVEKSDIPERTSQLVNDSGFVLSSNVYTKTQVDDALKGKLSVSKQTGKLTSALSAYYGILVEEDTIRITEDSDCDDRNWFELGYSGKTPRITICDNVKRESMLNFPTNKTGVVALASDIPSSLSQLSNDSGFVVSSDVYTKDQVDGALSGKLNTSGDQRISGNLTIKRYFSVEDSDNKNIYFDIGADGYIYKGYSNGKETHVRIPDATGELALVSEIPTTDKIKGIFTEQLDDKISQDKITSLAEAAIKDKAMPTEGAAEGSVAARIVALEEGGGGMAFKHDDGGYYIEIEEA